MFILDILPPLATPIIYHGCGGSGKRSTQWMKAKYLPISYINTTIVFVTSLDVLVTLEKLSIAFHHEHGITFARYVCCGMGWSSWKLYSTVPSLRVSKEQKQMEPMQG